MKPIMNRQGKIWSGRMAKIRLSTGVKINHRCGKVSLEKAT